jgi:hypothetical protein
MVVKRAGVPSTVAVLEQGSVRFDLIDDDGEALPGRWAFDWTGRDPLELAIYAVTELSGKPWKWTSRKLRRATLSPDRARAMSIRCGKTLRKENRTATAQVIARIVAHECLRPGEPGLEQKEIERLLSGKREADWEAGPTETTPAMLRAFRQALKAAVEAEAGLAITWGKGE